MLAILRDPTVRIIPQSDGSFHAGLDLFRARPNKRYSLTDCISMQVMRREGPAAVLTNDRHFEQEGFRALFREDLQGEAQRHSSRVYLRSPQPGAAA